jgi:uncharacterized protein
MRTSEGGRPLAVVTGASSGIGLALAEELVDRGYDLVVSADDLGLHAVAADLRTSGAEVVVVQADLATQEGVAALSAAVRRVGRTADALLVNAGVVVHGPFVETSLDDELQLVDLNVRGPVQLAHDLLPAMVERGVGRVMFTSSVAASLPGSSMATYNASKAFLRSFAAALRDEVSSTGVTVTALMPGVTDTRIFERAGMQDTRIGRAPKDDPSTFASQGIDAMLAGRDHVVTGARRNRLATAAEKVLPSQVRAKVSAILGEPGGSL